jgi:hypothetical protein
VSDQSDGPDVEGLGIDILEMQSALARDPQPTYQMLLAGSPVLRNVSSTSLRS